MIRSPLASRRALTHLARLRARPDEDGAGAAIYCVMLLGLVVSTLLADSAHANRVERVALNSQADSGITLRVLAERPPAFQVFRIPGENTFALELPGSSLRGTRLERPDDHPVLAQVRLDKHQKGNSRVVLRFLADVDYEANAQGRELEIRFQPLRDISALKAAFVERQKGMKRVIAAAEANELQQKEAALHARGLALEKKEKNLAQSQREFDQQRRDFEKERDAVLHSQTERKAHLDATRVSNERQLETLRQAQRALAAQKEKLATEKRAYESTRKEQEKLRAAQRRENERAKTALRNTERLMQEAQANSDKLLAQVRSLRAEAEQIRADIAQQMKKREQMEQSSALLRSTAAAEAKSFAQKEQEFRARHDRSQAELAKLESRLTALRNESSKESATLAKLKKERELALQNANARALSQATQATTQQAADVAREKTLQEQLQRQQEKIASLRAELRERDQRIEAERARQNNELAAREQQIKQAQERFLRTQSAWQKREEQLQEQIASLEQKRVETARTAANVSRGTGFGGPQPQARPAAMPTTNGRLFEFGQGNRLGGALHHLSVKRQGLFSSRVGLQIQGKIRYSVERSREREVVLTLHDTYAANLAVRRILDTRDLGTNVLRILPRVVESDENKVVLTIELRQAAAVSASSESGILWLQFGQPGS